MSNATRASLLKGPAYVSYDSGSFHAFGQIDVQLVTEFFDAAPQGFGVTQRRLQDRRVEVTFAPAMWNNLSVLFPYASKQIGDTLFPATDKALVITPRNGAPLTIPNAAITGLPNLRLSAVNSLIGNVTFTGLCADGADPATLSNFFTFGSAASNVAQSGLDLTKIANAKYTLARNSVDYLAADGFSLDWDLQTEADRPDGDTTINYRLTGLGATLRFTPSGMTEANYGALLEGLAVGAAATGYDGTITGGSAPAVSVALDNLIVETANLNYGPAANRTGEVVMRAVRTVTSGALNALWTIS